MPDQTAPAFNPDQPMVYELKLRGHLGSEWTGWFQGETIALQENGDTVLTCTVADQAALHGLLRKVRDLGVILLAVNCMGGVR